MKAFLKVQREGANKLTTLEEYVNEIRPEIKAAINGHLPIMALNLSDIIEESAKENVYSYEASEAAMESRRYAIGSKANQIVTIGDLSLEIYNFTIMQDGTPNEVDIVESGDAEYNQPYPRPFMDEARDIYAAPDGMGEWDVAEALMAAGFTVV